MREEDVAFGKAAIAQGLVTRETVSGVFKTLAPTTTLRDELVRRGVLSPEQASGLAGTLDGPTIRGSPASRPGPSNRDGALPAPGDRLGDYEIESLLGKGGMGAVFKGRHLKTGHEAAIKVLLVGDEERDDEVQRFRREAEAMAKVDRHAGIVRVRSGGTFGPRQLPFAVMDFVRGHDLAKELKGGPMPVPRALAVVAKVARAIAHCHAQGILHRDLKPANVLVREEDQEPLVTDFGLARDAALSRLTKTGELLGTPAYMAPEQANGIASDHDERTDVYGLGAILYECLAGSPPFKASSQVMLLKKVIFDEPADPGAERPEVPRDASVVALKCLAKEKKHRYASAAELADELERLLRGEPVHARPPTRIERLVRRARRRPLIAAAWTFGPIFVAVGAVWKHANDTSGKIREARLSASRDLEHAVYPGRTTAPIGSALAPIDAALTKLEGVVGSEDAEMVLLRRWRDLLADPRKVLQEPGDRAIDAAAAIALLPEEPRAVAIAEGYLNDGRDDPDHRSARALLGYARDRGSPRRLDDIFERPLGDKWRRAVDGAILETLDRTASGKIDDRVDGFTRLAKLAEEKGTFSDKACILASLDWLKDCGQNLDEADKGRLRLPLFLLAKAVRSEAATGRQRAALDEIQRALVHDVASHACSALEARRDYGVVREKLLDLDAALSLTGTPMPDEIKQVLEQAAFTAAGAAAGARPDADILFAVYAFALRQGYLVPELVSGIRPDEWRVPPSRLAAGAGTYTKVERERSKVVERLAAATALLFVCRRETIAVPRSELKDRRQLLEANHAVEDLTAAKEALEGALFEGVSPELRDRLRAIERFEWAQDIYSGLVPIAPGGSRVEDAAHDLRALDAVIAAVASARALGHPRVVDLYATLLQHLGERCEARGAAQDAAGARSDAEAIAALGAEARARYDTAKEEEEELILSEERHDVRAADRLAELRFQGLYVASGDKTIWSETYWKEAWAWATLERLGDSAARTRRQVALEKGLDFVPDPNRRVDLAEILEKEGRLEEALGQLRSAIDGWTEPQPFIRQAEALAIRDRIREKLGSK